MSLTFYLQPFTGRKCKILPTVLGGPLRLMDFSPPQPYIYGRATTFLVREPIHSEAFQVGISKVLGRCFSAFLSAGKKSDLECCWWEEASKQKCNGTAKKKFKKLSCLYGGIIVQAVSVVANDSKYMVLQDQEGAQGLLNKAVKVKQVLV